MDALKYFYDKGDDVFRIVTIANEDEIGTAADEYTAMQMVTKLNMHDRMIKALKKSQKRIQQAVGNSEGLMNPLYIEIEQILEELCN